ncbi:MAG: hypothetical protein HYV13_00405 [Candidatus Doudnabacteria bacterium]|nr:hypothetical protein [Candidatus Doudnabacteria bacterium]
MKGIIYSPHLEFRLKLRQIPKSLVKRIFRTSSERYFDTLTRKYIVVSQVKYKNQMREMAVIYEMHENQVVLITIHPLKFSQKLNRIKSERWQII